MSWHFYPEDRFSSYEDYVKYLKESGFAFDAPFGTHFAIIKENTTSMNRYQIENLMQTLAMSQGMYGRMLDQIYSAPEDEQERFWENMEAQNFGDALDVVLFLEG